MGSEYKEELLFELLPLYYARLFPVDLFCDWISYGEILSFR